ncbi:hypothetical protein M436DRAFT_50619, partial [Aureobasidium namibiae CBS 147.97]
RDLLQENERLKRVLRKCQEDGILEYNSLVDEYNEAVDLYGTAKKKIRKLREKNEDLKGKNENLQDEVADLEQERDGQMIRAKEKTQKIRDMVKERNDLQEKLAQVVEKTGESRVSLDYEVKQSIAASTRLDKQLGDETFRKVMDQIYERFRECFLMVRRKQEFDVRSMLSSDGYLTRFLSKRVPSWRDNTSDDKLHVCISLVSRAFTQFVNNQFVFGLPNKDPIQAAWWAWITFAENTQTPKAQQDVKRWLALTSTVLTTNYRESMLQARADSLELLLDNMKEHLETVTTLDFTDAIRRRLSDAIAPHLTTLRMLHYQEWNYKLDMMDASRKGSPVQFSRARMEGMFWEETGFVKASLFPQLCRIEEDVEVDETEEDEEDAGDGQDDRYTVICKARVAVVDAWEEDMEDAEDIDVEVKTGLESMESPERPGEDAPEKDSGEPMDVDRMSGLVGEGEAPRTPGREHSAIVIPDSLDRDEEELAYGKGWPH